MFTEIFTRSDVFVTRILGRKAAPYSSRLRFQNKDTHTNIHTYIETGQAFNIDDQQYLKGRICMFSFKKGQLQVNTSYKAIQLEIRSWHMNEIIYVDGSLSLVFLVIISKDIQNKKHVPEYFLNA